MSRLSKKDFLLLKRYYKFLQTVPEKIARRQEIINLHLPPIHTSTDDNIQKLANIIGKPNPYPNIFLASSLGFTKMTWNKNVEKILLQFGLEMKLKNPTFKNYRKYEQLKMLMLKYFEKKKENEIPNV